MDMPLPIFWESDDEDDEGEDNVSARRQNENNVSVFGIFKNGFSRDIWTRFIGYDPTEGDHRMETTIVSITRLDAWFSTVLLLMTEQDKRGGGRQKDYNITFHKNHVAAMNRLIKRLFNFVMFWEPGELTVPDVPDGELEHEIKNYPRTATYLIDSPIHGNFFIVIKSDWFDKYISSCMGDVHDCYIAKISSDWTQIIPLSTEDVEGSCSLADKQSGTLDHPSGDPSAPVQPIISSTPQNGPENPLAEESTPAPDTVPPMPRMA